MNCCPRYESGEAYAFAIITVWIELGCGGAAAAYPAFVHEKAGNTWAQGIFWSYTVFAFLTFLYTGWTICSRKRRSRENCVVMNWLCILTTFITLAIFYYYLGHPETPLNGTVVNLFGLYIVAVAFLSIGYVCSVNFIPDWTDPCPLVVTTILIELGTGLFGTSQAALVNDKANLWAYSIFGIYGTFSVVIFWYIGKELWAFANGKKSKMVYGLLDICTLLTGGCFCLLFFTQFALPSGKLSKLEREIFWSFIVYIFAVDALLLLLFRWTFSIPGCDCDDLKEDSDWLEDKSESGDTQSRQLDLEKGLDFLGMNNNNNTKMICDHLHNSQNQELHGSASTLDASDFAFEVGRKI
ncbi:unnamed protein product [Orchesella dallaii]|uniref:Uncharacterized protein n=1 Tax=Orchesella dallaii TaxID=48710 RepID=A0ABP1RVG1_9HEXA